MSLYKWLSPEVLPAGKAGRVGVWGECRERAGVWRELGMVVVGRRNVPVVVTRAVHALHADIAN